MPTYQYACTACDERLEAVQKFSDDPLTECSNCGGRLRKVFSPVGIVFKGSGFYRTDSRNGSGPNGSKTSQQNGSAGDSKPAAEKSAGGDSGKPSGETAAKKSTPDGSSSGGAGSSGSGSSTASKVA